MLSPVRVEIAEFLRCNGEATIGELARMMCRSPEALYRHMDILVKAGLVVQTGYRKKGRHVERVFDLPADDYFLVFKDHGTREDNQVVVDTMGCFSRVLDRTVKRAAAARLFDFDAKPRNVLIRYEMSWLKREQVVELHSLVARVKEIMDDGRKDRTGTMYRWMAVLCPFAEKIAKTRTSSANKKTTKKANPSPRSGKRGEGSL